MAAWDPDDKPDRGPERIRGFARFLRRLSPYEWRYAYLKRKGKSKTSLAYRYVLGWVAVLLVILWTSDSWAGDWALRKFLVIVAAFRLADIFLYYVDLLLDSKNEHHTFISQQRNLIFSAANLFEISLIAAIFLLAARAYHVPAAAWFRGFSLVTQLDVYVPLKDWTRV